MVRRNIDPLLNVIGRLESENLNDYIAEHKLGDKVEIVDGVYLDKVPEANVSDKITLLRRLIKQQQQLGEGRLPTSYTALKDALIKSRQKNEDLANDKASFDVKAYALMLSEIDRPAEQIQILLKKKQEAEEGLLQTDLKGINEDSIKRFRSLSSYVPNIGKGIEALKELKAVAEGQKPKIPAETEPDTKANEQGELNLTTTHNNLLKQINAVEELRALIKDGKLFSDFLDKKRPEESAERRLFDKYDNALNIVYKTAGNSKSARSTIIEPLIAYDKENAYERIKQRVDERYIELATQARHYSDIIQSGSAIEALSQQIRKLGYELRKTCKGVRLRSFYVDLDGHLIRNNERIADVATSGEDKFISVYADYRRNLAAAVKNIYEFQELADKQAGNNSNLKLMLGRFFDGARRAISVPDKMLESVDTESFYRTDKLAIIDTLNPLRPGVKTSNSKAWADRSSMPKGESLDLLRCIVDVVDMQVLGFRSPSPKTLQDIKLKAADLTLAKS